MSQLVPGIASTASSILNLTSNLDVDKYSNPATNPVITAAHGSTTPQDPVIATSPPRHPFMVDEREKDPSPDNRSSR
jgi:hypothetical protein